MSIFRALLLFGSLMFALSGCHSRSDKVIPQENENVVIARSEKPQPAATHPPFGSAPHPTSRGSWKGKCVAVTSGDEILVTSWGYLIKVKLSWIECPKLNQLFGKQAKKVTSGLVLGQFVEVGGNYRPDGVYVAEVYVSSAKMSGFITAELVKRGLAWRAPGTVDSAFMQKILREAQSRRLGLWSQKHPIPPWKWRGTR